MNFSGILLNWYQQNKRELPWRKTKDPYFIWLSEIIMQQTRVEQGTPYYKAFIKNYPSVKHLANAPGDEVLKLWQGLGYYSRARNLHEAAKYIATELSGKFPESYLDILKLKGIGEYTAAAIASFAFHQPYPVIDGNVYRVLSRVFGITTPVDSTEGKKTFKALAYELLDKKDPATYNQAIMEFGAMYCKPVNPDCEQCVFAHTCLAKAGKLVKELPVKQLKTKVRERHFQYIVLRYKSLVWLRKRTEKDIWQGLFDFPMIESLQALSETELKKSDFWKKHLSKLDPSIRSHSATYKHVLSHQRIFATFWEIKLKKKALESDWTETDISRIFEFPVPRLIDLYLETGPESLS